MIQEISQNAEHGGLLMLALARVVHFLSFRILR